MFEQFEIEDNLIIGNRNSKEMKVEDADMQGRNALIYAKEHADGLQDA